MSNQLITKTESKLAPKNISDSVLNSVNTMIENHQLQLPSNYVVGNALKSAYLKLSDAKDKNGDSVLQTCSQPSIANALLKMVILGLNPAKDQAYFVAYGKDLTLMTSYFGKITAIKRIKGVVDVRADVIYEDTDYELIADEFGNDSIKINKPCPLDKRLPEKIVGGWAKIIFDPTIWGTTEYSCVMPMLDIKNAWNQGATKGNSPAHKNFTGEMVKKTVINRCIKNYINSRDDQDVVISALKETISNEYETPTFEKEEEVIDFNISSKAEEAEYREVQNVEEIEFE